MVAKISEPITNAISKVGAMELIAGEAPVLGPYEDWLDLVKTSKKEGGSVDVPTYIINEATGVETPFFNYEGVFRMAIRTNAISEDAVQAMADAIDIPDDGDDDDDDEDEEEEEDDEIETKGELEDPLLPVFGTDLAPSKSQKGADDEESDATVDMDEATEEDLQKMESALANVFAAKKQMKNASRLSKVRYTRILNLVDLVLGRQKDLPLSTYVILLMPLVTALKHNLTVLPSQNNNSMKKTLSTLRRLSKFKKFPSSDEIDKGALLAMATEIRSLMKKKYMTKEAKNVLFAFVQTLQTIGGFEMKKGKPKQQSSPDRSNVNGSTEKKSSKPNKKKNAPAPPQVNGSNNSDDKPGSGVKRKAQRGMEKKKAKLLRMTVLNEGLSNLV